MATIEEMNKVISEYAGYEAEPYQNIGGSGWRVDLQLVPNGAATHSASKYGKVENAKDVAWSNEYHKSWDWLMPVWKKLRDELIMVHSSGMSDNANLAGEKVNRIVYVIGSVEIEQAHSLIFEAIVWLQEEKHPSVNPTP